MQDRIQDRKHTGTNRVVQYHEKPDFSHLRAHKIFSLQSLSLKTLSDHSKRIC